MTIRNSIFFKYLICLVFIGGFALTSQVHGQTNQSKIVVIVNKNVITEADVTARLNLIIMTSGMERSASVLKSMRGQVISSLIDEALQKEAAAELKILVTDAHVNKALTDLAKSNSMTVAQMTTMFKGRGVNINTLKERLRAQIAWAQYAQKRYGYFANANDAEVMQELKSRKESSLKTQYEVGEIFLSVRSAKQVAAVKAQAQQLYDQISAGASFEEVARQFSQSNSSKNGGDIGVVYEGQIGKEKERALKLLEVGHVSKPVRTPQGYYILQLRNRVKPGEANPKLATIRFTQATIPASQEMPQYEMMEVMNKVESLKAAKGCKDFVQRAKEAGIETKSSVDISYSGIADGLKQLINSESGSIQSKVGRCMQPAMTPNGVIMIMVCAFNKGKQKPPTESEVRAALQDTKLSMYADRDIHKRRTIAYVKCQGNKQGWARCRFGGGLPTTTAVKG